MALALSPSRDQSRPGLAAMLAEFAAILGAAIRVSAAIDNRRRPAAADLDRLGIPAGALPRA